MKRKLRLYSVILFPITILLMVILPSEKSIMNILLFSIVVFISLWLISFFVEGNSKNNIGNNIYIVGILMSNVRDVHTIEITKKIRFSSSKYLEKVYNIDTDKNSIIGSNMKTL